MMSALPYAIAAFPRSALAIFVAGLCLVAAIAYRVEDTTPAPRFSPGDVVHLRMLGEDVMVLRSSCYQSGCIVAVRRKDGSSLSVYEFEARKL